MSDDKDLRDLFTRQRETDRSQAPSFDSVTGERPSRAARPARRIGRPIFAASALAAAATVAALALVTPWREVAREADSLAPMSQDKRRATDAPPPLPAATPETQTMPPAPAQPAKPPRKAAEHRNESGSKDGVRSAGPANPAAPSEVEPPAAPMAKQSAAPGRGDAMPSQEFNQEFNDELKVMMSRAAAELEKTHGGFAHVKSAREKSEFFISDKEILAPGPAFNTESYAPLPENPFLSVVENPVSTFSVDVDTASYSIVRRFLESGQLPPRDAVRIEELINYFPYDDPPPSRGSDPFAVSVEMAGCPWEPRHRLARVALRGKEIDRGELPGSNLVFLLDVSGSMDEPAKLPLVRSSLAQLVSQLDGRDEVAMVVYAGASGLVLPPTRGSRKSEILGALDRLQAGGSTNGGEGLRLAYATARGNFIRGGVNRVILATDGDFNVGITDQGELIRFVEEQARQGVFLTVLGFGMGNYKDDRLEMLADKGNGNYAYIDSREEARKALVEQIGGTLVTIAKDVKIQIEFNPAEVGAYRLIGYENRMLRREDFNDDRKDAGDIGSGHTVTALYEVVPAGDESDVPSVDPLKYQRPSAGSAAAPSGEAFTVKLRYKDPDGSKSHLITRAVVDEGASGGRMSDNLRFAAAVAAFGMILKDSPNRGDAGFDLVLELAGEAQGEDEGGYRREFTRLVRAARSLSAER